MNSTLLGLPREIKELIYFDALSHTAEKILVCTTPPASSYVLTTPGPSPFS
jgi:exocyst complex component 6